MPSSEWPTPEAIEAVRPYWPLTFGCTCPWDEDGNSPPSCRCAERSDELQAEEIRKALTAAAKASPVIPAPKVERLRAALGRANDRVDSFLASAPASPDPAERLALRDLQETAEWYVRCLDDVRAQRPARGLGEAEAAYASAQKRAKAVLDGR